MASNILTSYKDYRKLMPEGQVDRKTFCKVNNDFNKFIMDLVFKGYKVRLPERMGTVVVKGKQVKPHFNKDLGRIDNQPIDYGETNKLWERCPECKERKQVVYHLNEHTNNVRYKFFWSRERILVQNKMFYNMVFTRANKRKLASLIKSGFEFFIEPKKY